MMLFLPTGADCSYILPRDGDPEAGVGAVTRERVLGWSVRSEWRNFVRLSSGEDLKDAGLEGSVRVEAGPPLTYSGTFDHPLAATLGMYREYGAYQIKIRVSDVEFDRVLSQVRESRIPTLAVGFPPRVEGVETRMAGGWDWDDKSHPLIEIAWWEFTFAMSPTRDEIEERNKKDAQAAESTRRAVSPFPFAAAGWIAFLALVAAWIFLRK